MKILLILLITGFAVYTKAEYYNDMEHIGFLQAIAIDSIAAAPCSDESIIENLKEEKKKAVECVRNIRYNSSFCDTFVHHFKPCVQELLEDSQKCENPSYAAMKMSILDSAIAEAGYVCGIDGEHIFELLNPCILKSVKKSGDCRKNLTKPVETTRDMETICRTIPKLKRCFEDQMHHECENEITKTAIQGFLDADVKPCNVGIQLFFELAAYLS